MKRTLKTKYVRRIAMLTALLVLVGLLSAGIPAAAETVSDEDLARIVTHGYDLSAFTVLDDSDDEVITSSLGETSAAVHLCGQAHFTGEVGSMTLFFEGNAIGLLAEKGGFDIYIDDEPVGKVWAAAVGAPQVVYYTEALTVDSHVITVVTNRDLATLKIGENYSVLEGFFVQTDPGKGSAGAEWTEFYDEPVEQPTGSPSDNLDSILTQGYDLSAFTVLDDTDEAVICSDLAETKSSAHLYGQAVFTGGTGTMSLDFEGTAVGLIVEKGGFDIYIDDDLIDTIWAASSGAPKVVFYKDGLSNDTHNITVVTNPELATEHIGENYSVLEGFFVQTEPGKGSATGEDPNFDPAKRDVSPEERAKINAGEYDLTDYRIVDDSAQGVVVSTLSTTQDASHLCGNASFSDRVGSVSYTFEGNSVGVLVEKGGFEIEIDGSVVGEFGAAYIGGPQVVFYTGTLRHGTHTIKVTTAPDVANEYTGEPWSVIEGFFVQKEPGKGSADGAPIPPTEAPTEVPTGAPTAEPTAVPTAAPTAAPTSQPADNTTAPVATGTNAATAPSGSTQNGGNIQKAVPFIIMGAVVLAALVVIAIVLIRKKRN